MCFSRKVTKKSKKWRGALISLALFGVAPMAFGAETRYVSDFAELKAAISEYNSNTGVDYRIILTNSITLEDDLPAITGNKELTGVKNGSLNIDGGNNSLNGAGEYRGFYIDAKEAGGTITVSGIDFVNCVAQGGDGGDGAAGGGGGLGAGAAIYAYSGAVVIQDITARNNTSIGGAGGTILQGSQSYGGGGGLGGNGGNGVVGETGAAFGGGIFEDGADSDPSVVAGDGGVTSSTDMSSYGHYVDKTTPVGGNSLDGGGGGGSVKVGGAGGFGGGGGAGGSQGGAGGFGAGGGGGDSEYTAGLGGFGAGDGGYIETVTSEQFSDTQGGGVGGGGAALGGAIFVGEDASVTLAVSSDSYKEIFGNTLVAGQGGGGTAEDGEAIGNGLFLLNDLTIEVAKGGTYVVSDSIGGYAGSSKVVADANGVYENMSGIVKTGEGTLILKASDSTYAGETIVNGGTLIADAEGAVSAYSNLNVEKGSIQLNANQSVKNLSGGTEGVVDLNSNTLSVTGDDSATYAGVIKGDGLLLKDGKGKLALYGDSRENGTFNTEIRGGTIQVGSDGAFGKGDVIYSRTDVNDQTAALDFANGVSLNNDVYLFGNAAPLVVSGGSAKINGNIISNQSQDSTVELRLNSGSTLQLNNTGVVSDENGNKTFSGKSNSVGAYKLVSGNLGVRVDSIAEGGNRSWHSSIGNSTINNSGNNSLSFVLGTDGVEDGLQFANNLVLDSGWLTINPTTLDGSAEQVKSITYAGTTSGAGGLRVNIGTGATMYATGALGHAKTDVQSGTLDVSGAVGATVGLGELTGSGVVNAGGKDLAVTVANGSARFDGAITGEDNGPSVYKYGSGEWTLNLTGDSKISAVEIANGVFSLGENHFDSGLYPSNDFKVEVWSQGAFKLSTDNGATLELDNFVASTPGGAIDIGANDELVLTSKNTSTEIAASLFGSGWIYLDNVVDPETNAVSPWILSGDNSNWEGTIAAFDNNAVITLASANAGSAKSKLNLGAHATVNVMESTNLGSLDFDNNLTFNVTSGKTLNLNGLTSNSLWLDDSVTTITGGGVVSLASGAGKTYYGETIVTNGSTLALIGDNRANTEYGGTRRDLTLTDGGVLFMNYANEGVDGTWTSLWGSDIKVDGNAGITIYDVNKVVPSGTGGYANFKGVVDLNDTISFVGQDNNELTFNVTNANSTAILRSEIQGSGSLVKQGAGVLTLDGTGEFSAVTIDSGILQLGASSTSVNDQLANSSIMIKGGTLAGWTDSLGATTLNSGVLNVLQTGSVKLNGSGNALTMNGGTIYINVLDKDNYTNFVTENDDAKVVMNGGAFYVDTATHNAQIDTNDSLTVVQTGANGLVVNKSGYTIYDDVAGKRFVVDLSALEQGKLNLVLKASNFSDLATTPNEQSVADVLDKWVDAGETDPDTKDFLSELENVASTDHSVLNQLTGELRLSAFNAHVQARNLIRQTLTQNVLPPARSGLVQTSALRGQVVESEGIGGWGSAFGAFGDADPHKGTTGYDFDLLGGIFGVELGRNETNQFGFYFSYGNLQLDAKSAMGSVELNDNQFGLYLRLSDEWGYTFATGSIGISDYDLNRAVALSTYPTLRYTGSTDGWSGSAYLERGFNFSLMASDLQPYGGLQYTHLTADGFKEGGSLKNLALKTQDDEFNSLEGVLGVRWLKSTIVGASQFDFNAYANWTHEFLDSAAEGAVALTGGPNGTIHVIGNSTGRDWIYGGLGGNLHMTDSFSVFGGSDVQVNDYTTYVNGHVGMKYVW